MAKIELTLTIDGVDQDIPVLDDEELTLQEVAVVSGAVTSALINVINQQQAEEQATLELEREEAALAAEQEEVNGSED